MRITGNRWFLAAMVLCVSVGLLSCAQTMTQTKKDAYTEEELGLRQETLYDESSTVPVHGETTSKEPGESTRFDRSFENSPPLVPHDITGMLPLEGDGENICMGCHMPEEAVFSGATPLPGTHLIDIDTGKYLKGKLDGARYNCLQCHVVQNILTPAVENIFKGKFRDERGRYRSNLINILNEGVEAE
jgi:cytochrome c-type protein NapB